LDLHSSWTRCSTYAARSIALLCLISGTALLYSQVTVHSQNFSSGFQGWSAVDLSDASDVWSISSGYAQINGYGGGNDEDWLISPAFDMDAQEDEYLLFDYNDAYDGDLLELYYSQDFSGAMNSAGINSATWVPLSLELIDINSSACFSVTLRLTSQA